MGDAKAGGNNFARVCFLKWSSNSQLLSCAMESAIHTCFLDLLSCEMEVAIHICFLVQWSSQFTPAFLCNGGRAFHTFISYR